MEDAQQASDKEKLAHFFVIVPLESDSAWHYIGAVIPLMYISFRKSRGKVVDSPLMWTSSRQRLKMGIFGTAIVVVFCASHK